MSKHTKHVHNPYTRRILCQRCHQSPARWSILSHIRLCHACKAKTFPSGIVSLKPSQIPLFKVVEIA